MAQQLSRKRAVEAPTIPDRLYFKIGDVARICGLETYVLRFWESQFPQLKPNKSGTGQRLYRRREVELVIEIKRLVHSEGYTLAGARQVLEHRNHRGAAKPAPKPEPLAAQPAPIAKPVSEDRRRDAVAAAIGHARAELREIAAILASPLSETSTSSLPTSAVPAQTAPVQVVRPMRRRPRLATFPEQYNTLFPT